MGGLRGGGGDVGGPGYSRNIPFSHELYSGQRGLSVGPISGYGGPVLGLYQVMVAQMGVSALSITWANINTGKTPSINAKPAADIYQDQHTL